MHSIIKLHADYGSHLPVYVFVDKIVDIMGDDTGSRILLFSNNDYGKAPLFVDESPDEILVLIADAEAAEADEEKALMSDALDYQKSLYQPSAAKIK